jgi:hypothetical protein
MKGIVQMAISNLDFCGGIRFEMVENGAGKKEKGIGKIG